MVSAFDGAGAGAWPRDGWLRETWERDDQGVTGGG